MERHLKSVWKKRLIQYFKTKIKQYLYLNLHSITKKKDIYISFSKIVFNFMFVLFYIKKARTCTLNILKNQVERKSKSLRKRLHHYLRKKCPDCELDMSKIIFQHFKQKMLFWFQVNNCRIRVGKKDLGHIMTQSLVI